jgi:hypothetical protein
MTSCGIRHGQIKLSTMSDDEDDTTVEMDRFEELQFGSTPEEFYELLRQDHPDIVRVTDHSLPRGYGRDLGNALLQNAMVSSLQINLHKCFASEGDSTTQQPLTGEEPLFQYLRESDSLEQVSLSSSQDEGDVQPTLLVNLAIQALANNRILQVMNIMGMNIIPSDALVFFLQNSKSKVLCELIGLGHGVYHPNTVTAHRAVARAIVNVSSLEILKLSGYDSPVLIHCLLAELGSECRFQWLEISCARSILPSLSPYLCATIALRSLTIAYIFFASEDMTLLEDGLLENQTVIHLHFKVCDFAADDSLLRFMHTCHGPTWSSKLRRLNIEGYGRLSPSRSTGSDIAIFLQGNPTSPGRPTPGTCLEDVAFRDIDHIGWVSLSDCLPSLLCLRRLTIRKVDKGVDVLKFVHSLRQNGTLQHISAQFLRAITENDEFLGDSVFTSPFQRLVDAYCKRNELLGWLLANPKMPNDESDKDDFAFYSREVKVPLPMVSYPTLFAVAVQCPRLSPTHVLTGLMAIEDDFGPYCVASKRAR